MQLFGPIEDNYALVDEIRVTVDELKPPIYATEGTAEALKNIGVPCKAVSKRLVNGNSAMQALDEGLIDLVIIYGANTIS